MQQNNRISEDVLYFYYHNAVAASEGPVSGTIWMMPVSPFGLGVAHGIGYPVLVRPSYVLGGRGLLAFRFAPCAIHVFLSAFAAITLEPVSSLCCGTHGFRGSQQFSLSSCGLSPHASRQLLVRGGHSLPLRFGTGIVVAVTLQKVNRAPNTKASAEGNNEGLENSNRFIKEIHTKYL